MLAIQLKIIFSIRINRVDGSESGEYKCTATNDAGTATAMANLVVQVRLNNAV